MVTEPFTQHHSFDVVVIGAGHAGCEAALAAARAGCRVLVVTPNLDRVGYMPCNPSVGGPGKSHIVAEVDALGGEMGRAADATALQMRLLNTSKGPAVQAIRTQQDKSLYAIAMADALASQDRIALIQDEVFDIGTDATSHPRVTSVTTRRLSKVECRAAVLTAGTFLRGALISGESRSSGGRAGDRADQALSASLSQAGFRLRRLKTGTPPRIDAATIDFSRAEEQPGDLTPLWHSLDGTLGNIQQLSLPPTAAHTVRHADLSGRAQLSCFKIGTNDEAHHLIRENLHRAPMFNGAIEGLGPRYCPSIEDKVARFPHKASHPIFLEPEGWRSHEYYVQGMSTSLPADVQSQMLRSIPALRDCNITRYGYAVEYDAIDPIELTSTLESRRVRGLFLAGQVNGTSGYEEAGGQGILAGLNAANTVHQRTLVTLPRDMAYIGVMVDDLANKPFEEPYRMLTSRAEYRLLLRPGSAHNRLAQLAYQHDLIDYDRLAQVQDDRQLIEDALQFLHKTRITQGAQDAALLQQASLDPVTRAMTAAEVLQRPQTAVTDLLIVFADHQDNALAMLPERLRGALEQEVKYSAFIEREARQAARQSSLESRLLPADLAYSEVVGLRYEARTRLDDRRPRTVGEASRLSGVTPSDIAALLVHTGREPAAV